MANHGKKGIPLADYHTRKLKPHKVSGRYTEGGRVVVMTHKQVKKKLNLRGDGKGKKVVHYAPFTCKGRGKDLVWKEAVAPVAATEKESA